MICVYVCMICATTKKIEGVYKYTSKTKWNDVIMETISDILEVKSIFF